MLKIIKNLLNKIFHSIDLDPHNKLPTIHTLPTKIIKNPRIPNYKFVCKDCILLGNCTSRCGKYIDRCVGLWQGPGYTFNHHQFHIFIKVCPYCENTVNIVDSKMIGLGNWEATRSWNCSICSSNGTINLNHKDKDNMELLLGFKFHILGV